MWFVVGLVILLISAHFLVDSARDIARHFGVSELIIGATIVAIGTSLPELAASITGALRGHFDMVIGNIIGSNIFNLAAVLAIAGVINPSMLPVDIVNRDVLFMLITTVMLVVAAILLNRIGRKIGKIFGGLSLAVYAGYLWMNFQAAI